MPTKFKPTVVQFIKNTNGTSTKINKHSYIKAASTKDILEALGKSSTAPKIKDKLRKELTRRQVSI